VYIAVTGASGLIGSALSRRLEADGHHVVPVTRERRDGAVHWDPERGELDPGALEGVETVVHLSGETIDGRWNEKKRQAILRSRVASTELLATTMARLDEPPRTWLSGSAVGYYGDRPGEVLTESSPPGSGFMAEVCVRWEAATRPLEHHGIRVAHLRTGIVISGAGGALKRALTPFRLGLGGPMAGGRQVWSWISIDDEVGAIVHLLRHDIEGPVNLTAPEAVTNGEFAKVLGEVLHRPAVVPIPRFALKLAFAEMADELLLASADVRPTVLDATGYRFAHPTLPTALRAALDG
jgi:uncharacterized protein (TIGR01777 family)